MKLSIYTGVKDGLFFDFHVEAMLRHHLPLADEIEIISGGWPDFVIMIDDFCVPGDDGYEFDDYGPGRRLDVEYLEPGSLRDARRFGNQLWRSIDAEHVVSRGSERSRVASVATRDVEQPRV